MRFTYATTVPDQGDAQQTMRRRVHLRLTDLDPGAGNCNDGSSDYFDFTTINLIRGHVTGSITVPEVMDRCIPADATLVVRTPIDATSFNVNVVIDTATWSLTGTPTINTGSLTFPTSDSSTFEIGDMPGNTTLTITLPVLLPLTGDDPLSADIYFDSRQTENSPADDSSSITVNDSPIVTRSARLL